ncbi:MAG: AMP-binding protein [Halanaerobiales bacterium]|nr:AMP-binding protein [Halanaerobiales bacterium]
MSKKAIQHGKPIILPEEYNSLAEMMVYVAQKYPQKGITYINVSGEEDFVSYLELVDNACKYLKLLYQQGVKPGDVVILEIGKSKDFYNAFWACIFGGIIAAPVSQPKSWELNSAGVSKLTQIWKVLKKPLIVMDKQNQKHYQRLQDSPHYQGLRFISTDDINFDEKEEIYYTKPDDLVFLQFSSGSTGVPKGVKLTNRKILTNIIAINQRIESQEDDVVFTWVPHTHDLGLFFQHLVPVVGGCNIMQFSPYTFVRSPYMFLKKITEHKGSWFCSPNFGFAWMVEKISDKQLSDLDLSSLRFILNGAEPISVPVIQKFTEKFSKCGYKENMMLPAYGMAEATVAVTIHEVGSLIRVESIYRSKMIEENIVVPVEDDNEKDKIDFVHEGLPIGGVSVRIADEQGNTLDENMIGEIQIKGQSVTSGYYNRDDINKDLFVDGWLHTGDLGFIVDNSLAITGRIKDILFIRGQNYFAHDLEEIIYDLETIKRGDIALVGLFNDKTQKEEIIVFIKYKFKIEIFIPIRKKIIERINEALGIEVTHVIPVRTIPKTTSGKVQRFQLRRRYENGEFNDLLTEIGKNIAESYDNEREINLPRNELEIFLHQSWSKILNIPEHKISIDDSFMALGGNSIKAYQLLDKIETYLNKDIGFEVLASCKTIRQIAEYLQKMPSESAKSLSDWQTDNKLDINKAIAITGMALRFPQAKNQEEFWDNLCSNEDSITKISSRRKELAGQLDWNDWIGELEDIDKFDNDFFDIPADEAIFMDPQQRLILETSHEALEDAGLITNSDEERNVGVYAGISTNTYNQLVTEYLDKHGATEIHQNTMVGNMANITSALISHTYNFTGPALAIDTACSSFMVALHYAVSDVRENRASGAVVAGANILATSRVHSLAKKAGIVSSTQYSKVFDKDADGTVLGEGVIVVYLEPLAKAVKENKNIYGVIRGTAINNDGYSLGIMAPNPKGQYNVLMDAYKDANLSPDEISYIEAHGTGTTIGDPIEINALSKLFSNGDKASDIGIGSVKTNVGHLLPAAGGAGLAKVLLCLKNQKLVPSLHMENVNPTLQLERTPFYIVKDIENWTSKDQKPRKAGISSLGLGGTNAHVVLEEWNESRAVPFKKKLNLLTLSAKSEKALEDIISQTQDLIKNNPDLDINDLCFTRNRYRKHYGYRAACLISDDDKTNALNSMSRGQSLKSKSAKISLVIGDIKNIDGQNERIFEEETSVLFKKDFSKIKDCAIKHGIINLTDFNRNQLLPRAREFTYWYSLVKNLKQNGANITDINGIESGQVLADLLNEKIDLREALESYFASKNINEKENNDDNRLSQFKGDILLNFCVPEENLLEILPKEIQKRLNIVNLELETYSSFDTKLHSAMRELYVAGANFDWEYIHPNGSGKLLHLPSYPFEQKSFWINDLKGE